MDDSVREIYTLVKKKMREQGAYDREAYGQFVDETIDYFYEKGKLDEDENEKFIKDQLMALWENLANNITDKDYDN